MEILNPLSTQTPQIISASSLISTKSIKIYRNKNPPNFKPQSFKFSLKTTPVFSNSTLYSSTSYIVSAHFNRTTKGRKNHLRKKLIEEKVRRNPDINHDLSLTPDNPIPKIDDTNYSLSNLETYDNDMHDSDPGSTDGLKSNNAMWNQLESWADQYNADVKEKIANAKFLAKETENGTSVLPSDTSVPKLVHSVGKSGFGDALLTFTSKPAFVPRLSKVGISVFCGFLMFLALKSFLRKEKGNKEEYSSLEKEMLRRKMKARMAKEKSVKGSVEVIQDSKEPEMVFTERPSLDKEELMNSITKVKTLNNKPMNFEKKIEEIRAMARLARETEKADSNSNESINDKLNEKEVKHAEPTSFDVPQGVISRILDGLGSADKGNIGNSDVSTLEVPKYDESVVGGVDTEKLVEKKSLRSKSRIISSVKEAREYLHKKIAVEKEKKQETEATNIQEVPMVPTMATNGLTLDFSGDSAPTGDMFSKDTKLEEKKFFSTKDISSKYENEEHIKGSYEKAAELGRAKREKWMNDNFHEFEPIVEKIRGGFRNNYMVAREKVKDVDMITELKMLQHGENEGEFEWMKDEKLKEIVFQVRENELMGRDPFYLMDGDDKALFFKGLEKKVEKENEKLRELHEYVHSNIENLDYGADGISLYDPPEKIIPRWKGPQPTTTMSQEFLDGYLDQRKALFAETLGNLDIVKRDSQNSLQSADEKAESVNLKSSKTVIEGSDGSIKPGKKSGKEFWQHTKKWSRGFIDSYNAENDPETKAIMKDIGKDLDRWITEKEIQDAADIMDKVPEKGKKFIAEKITKLKREMELFGPQAVVSKYSEYGDDEEIDYYWWLDLPFLLCIELYIDGDGQQRIGFYSLEMASDLELDPKPHHIIAFEDAGDCKNLCYIIQAHMEMLGNGNAFVVPQLPKDTYREAKANGFNVTVIRKGELKLDVDQTLEEVEEKIADIGSKMYHDKIMKDRNVNVDSVMKGVFGLKKPTKRRSKKLKKPTK